MASLVDFPGAPEEPLSSMPVPAAGRRPPHLPFRRISMPSVPSAATLAQLRTANLNTKKDHRVSVASQQSTDSLPEYQRVSEYNQHNSSNNSPVSSPKPRRTMSRPSSLQPPPKTSTVTASTVAKRKKVLRELLDTEKTYLDGLEFINEHFLGPLVNATTEGRPLLSPSQMASIFSNFLDMLGFHESFYCTLNDHLGPYVKSTPPPSAFPASSPTRATFSAISEFPPPVASLLAQHIPFLSMYTPFVTAYPTIMASLHNLTSTHSASYSPRFAVWLKERESDPRCGRFGLRDWLLTLVQRCPRYLLMIKELLGYTDPSEAEYGELEEVSKMLEKINNSLNTSLQTQSITLQLLAVQKATPNLPIPFIEPGRTFIKGGPLFQTADRVERIREFFLFSDCLVWLSKGGEREGATSTEEEFFKQAMINSPSSASFSATNRRQSDPDPHPFKRTPSRTPSSAPGSKFPGSTTQGEEEKWWFRGKIDLLDMDISLPVATFGGEGKIDVHSPQMSFSLFCDSSEERDAWASAIRSAKQSRLVALNSTNPNSTLTSSTSNQHLRLALQALPYAPEEVSSSSSPQKRKGSKKDKEKSKGHQRRGHVEHFVPAIWVPDSKADSCLRCGGVFGWRRRRHHCRLCGNCVCGNCSGKTFFITSKDSSKDQTKPARACNSCYEAVFPVLDPESPDESQPSGGALPHYSSIGTLTALPFSRSTPSLALPQATTPILHPPPLHYELPIPVKRISRAESDRPKSGLDFLPLTRPRMPGSRPSSELRSSSYTVSTLASSNMFEPTNDTIATMSMLDSSVNSSSLPMSEGMSRPRPKTTFSVPAVALHTTPVTARASMETDGKAIRYSLVLGGKSKMIGGNAENKDNEMARGRKSLDSGMAAGRLNDLLVRR